MKDRIDYIENTTKLDKISIWLLRISVIIILLSFFTPYILTRTTFTCVEFSETGPIGDTIGGIMNPFIAIAGVALTFLAFYIQFKANKTQFELFRLELDNQVFNNKKQEIENKFYEMLRLHKENVNESSILCLQKTKVENGNSFVEHTITGRPVFELLRKEFELLYYLTKESFEIETTFEHFFNEAYGNWYHGIKKENINKHPFFEKIDQIIINHEYQNFFHLESTISAYSKIEWQEELKFELFKGRTSILAHYFRHLFQTVKFIANQDESLISYEEKRNFIRLLRAQLSDSEQALLLYNWKSKFGSSWENDINHFFTDYRMIHNLYQHILIDDLKLDEIKEFKREFRKEAKREFDPLFQLEDWLAENKNKLPYL